MSEYSDAKRNEGSVAFYSGKSLEDNPYKVGSAERGLWRNGFNTAERGSCGKLLRKQEE